MDVSSISRSLHRAYPDNGLLSTDDGGPTASTTSIGPITSAPGTATESGIFATSTASISGLTANSATTTSADGHATILPIWYVSAGLGIILIPGAGVAPGGVIPPPPGYPTLVIDEGGQVHEADDSDSMTSTSSTTTSSCTSCSSCVGFDILSDDTTSTLDNDGDPDLPTIDPSIWAAMETKYPLPGSVAATTTSTSDGTTQTQPAKPIDEPGCQDASDAIKSDLEQWTTKGNGIRLTDGSYHSVNDILYMLREVVCSGSCTAPSAIDSKYVAAYQKDGLCEISVALSSSTELFVNRDTWPDGSNKDFNTIWQECWDSTQNILDKCVDNQAKSGWWNGDHVYQFYEAGVRSLNDPAAHHTQNAVSLGSYLEPTTDGLSCGSDCCGYVPNGDWCIQNCDGTCKRGNRWTSNSRDILPRGVENVATVGGCKLPYTLPDYPSSEIASGILGVQKYYDRDDTISGSNNCDNPRLTGPGPRKANSNYDTEHVFEKHIIKRFLYFLVGGQQAFDESSNPDERDPVATCADVEAVFNQLNPAGVNFKTETAAQQLGKAISCQGSQCPDDSRVGEFFLLRREINGIKNRIFTGHYTGIGSDANDNKLPSCNSAKKDNEELRQTMINAAMVFQYMNKQEVYEAFKAVHNRILGILANLDADMLGTSPRPRNLQSFTANGSTWLDAYNEFMKRFLVDTERKMGLWLHNCKQAYSDKIDQSTMSQDEKDATKRKVTDYASGTGVYADGALKLDINMWGDIRGTEES
ncbi:hypothetical protein LQW54_011901 [Pestalotiopsis sp. IQ-011]